MRKILYIIFTLVIMVPSCTDTGCKFNKIKNTEITFKNIRFVITFPNPYGIHDPPIMYSIQMFYCDGDASVEFNEKTSIEQLEDESTDLKSVFESNKEYRFTYENTFDYVVIVAHCWVGYGDREEKIERKYTWNGVKDQSLIIPEFEFVYKKYP